MCMGWTTLLMSRRKIFDDTNAARVNFIGVFALVAGTTVVTMISKYFAAALRSANLVEVIFDEHDVFRPPEPAVRHGLPARSGAAHFGRSHRGAEGRRGHDVGSVLVAATFWQPAQPVLHHNGRAGELLPDQARLLHR